MMKRITGEMFETSGGTMIVSMDVPEKVNIQINDIVEFEGGRFIVTGIVPPTRPEAKWALQVKKEE